MERTAEHRVRRSRGLSGGALTPDGAVVALAYAGAAVLGLVIGSFLNVVVWRVPRGESVVSPPSGCPRCGHTIRSRDNVPVVSWVLLRGRCRDCGAPISARYPLVELVTAVLFCLVVLRFGLAPPEVYALPAFLYLAAAGLALALIDLDVHRLPDAIVLPSYVVGAVGLLAASWAAGDWPSVLRAVLGAVILFAFYFVILFAYPRGMGFGDVKLAGVLGLYLGWIGWGALVVGGFAAFVLGGVYAVGLLLAGRVERSSGIPFGPWMIAGAAVGIAWGEGLWAAYLGALT